MYIEVNALEHFSTTDQEALSSSSHSHTCHVVFHLLLSDNRKQVADTAAAHIKWIIELLKNSKCLGSVHINLWKNTDWHAEYYICATELYIFSILLQSFYIMI